MGFKVARLCGNVLSDRWDRCLGDRFIDMFTDTKTLSQALNCTDLNAAVGRHFQSIFFRFTKIIVVLWDNLLDHTSEKSGALPSLSSHFSSKYLRIPVKIETNQKAMNSM